MSDDREEMSRILKEEVVPVLREHGFKGSFPHFRRHNRPYLDLLSFQFDKYGGGFTVEIAKCSDRVNHEGLDKITAQHINDKRPRLSPTIQLGNDYWFRYDKRPLFGNVYRKVAKEVILLFSKQAEAWWADEGNVSTQEYVIGKVSLRKLNT